MAITYSTLYSEAQRLVRLLEEEPDLMAQLSPPREQVVLTKKPKVGEKIHNGKPKYNRSVDYTAAELKTDLILAMKARDYDQIATNYYQLAHLIGYL